MSSSGLSALPGIGFLAFAVTDIDDLFVLVALFASRAFRTGQVVLGQYLGIAALVAVSATSYFLRLVLPGEWIGLAGILPIVLGIREALDLCRELRGGGEEADASETPRGRGGALSVAAVTIANGGDNVGVYVPLFASSSPLEIALLAATFLLMTAVWLLLAWLLVSNRLFGRHIRRVGRFALPVVLVGLGVFILLKQESWHLVARLMSGSP
jgi:cadmium resistance protein CadD (predicted permease)